MNGTIRKMFEASTSKFLLTAALVSWAFLVGVSAKTEKLEDRPICEGSVTGTHQLSSGFATGDYSSGSANQTGTPLGG